MTNDPVKDIKFFTGSIENFLQLPKEEQEVKLNFKPLTESEKIFIRQALVNINNQELQKKLAHFRKVCLQRKKALLIENNDMKCKYCGAEIGNSIECHLCGHKQIGKTTCPVCSKLIYPYQEYCSNCGSPTIYRKSDPIKKVTPDTSVHSEASHNYHTVSESYDYKKNAYDYKKPFKDLNKYVPVSYTHLRAHET